ncbi:MAG: prephenate/arogenate dehydrogenase family protein [Henriciella sp.]
MDNKIFPSIAIIGVGLLGASIAHAVRAYGGAGEVRLFDHNPDARAMAEKLVPGQMMASASEAVHGAEAVFLCVPVGALGKLTEEISSDLKPGAILTDVGSVKHSVTADMAASCPDTVHLIPGHPIAGTEKSGPASGFADLFAGAWHILTPLKTDTADYKKAIETLSLFWSTLGAKVELMSTERHDRVLAITSHLPHLIAYNIVATAYDMESVEEGEVVKYSAGGFRDFTRIAASDPIMWRDVFLNNKTAVLETLGRFSEDLAALQRAIRWSDGDMLVEEFKRARGIRKAIIEAGIDTDEPDFGRRSSKATNHD